MPFLDRLSKLLPALLLISVAVNQMYLVHEKNLVPWKGGGFGMFTSLDDWSMRRFSISIKDAKGSDLRVVPGAKSRIVSLGDLREEWNQLRSLPDRERIKTQGKKFVSSIPGREVTVSLWKLKFDVKNNRLHWVRVDDVRLSDG